MTHTYECSIDSASRELQIRAYRMLWTDRCDYCHGTGGFMEPYDPATATGVALSPNSMEECVACFFCVEDGVCPRCDTHHSGGLAMMAFEQQGWCYSCQWSWKDASTHEPPPYECGCWWHRLELVRW